MALAVPLRGRHVLFGCGSAFFVRPLRAMNARTKLWFEDAKASGMPVSVAYLGTEVIDSFETFWKHEISDENLRKMKRFGIQFPEAASHRWSLVAGPCPWFPRDGEEEKLKQDPKFSPHDLFSITKNETVA